MIDFSKLPEDDNGIQITWTLVSDAMPPEGEYVVVCGYQKKGEDLPILTFYNTAYIMSGRWSDDVGLFEDETVIAWMRLPKPPSAIGSQVKIVP